MSSNSKEDAKHYVECRQCIFLSATNLCVLTSITMAAAARVLAKGHHVLLNTELSVKKPPLKDRRRLLLRGTNPSTSTEMIELYVENMMDLNMTDYTLIPSPERDVIVIQLSQPLSKGPINVFSVLQDKISDSV